jgi:hypothetical protein
VAQPGQRDVAGDREREGADGADLLGLLQQLVDVGGIARAAVQAGAQDSLELERGHEVAVVVAIHIAPDGTWPCGAHDGSFTMRR